MEKLERTVIQYLKEQHMLSPGDRVLIACSGGVDSMALLQFFYKFQEALAIHIAAVHVDHMLRAEQSAGDRQFVEQFCMERGIECFSTAINIPAILQNEGGNSQHICRRERYRYFNEIAEAEGFSKVMTAHHADDQLESLLMALAKSNVATSLKGIVAVREFDGITLLRPFLMVTKGEIGEYLQKSVIAFREDASNKKDDYLRNRIRHQVVPLLKAENPQISSHAVQISSQLQADDSYLLALAKQQFEQLFKKSGKDSYSINVESFQNVPLALQRRLILILLNYLYSDSNTIQSYTLNTSILKLFGSQDGSAMINLPEGLVARRQYSEITFGKKTGKERLSVKPIELNEWVIWRGFRIYIGELTKPLPSCSSKARRYYMQSTQFVWPLSLRTRRDGDRMIQAGMQQYKKLSRIFIDGKIPSAQRNDWPILVDVQQEILAVIGVRVSNKLAKTRGPQDDYILILEGELFGAM